MTKTTVARDTTAPSHPTTSTRTVVPRLGRAGLAAAAGAAVANVLIHAVASAGGASFLVRFGGDEAPFEIGALQVGLTTLLPVAVATLIALLAARRSPVTVRGVQGLAVAVTLVSLGGPLSLEAETGAAAALATMHLVTGAAFIAAVEVARPRSSTPSSSI